MKSRQHSKYRDIITLDIFSARVSIWVSNSKIWKKSNASIYLLFDHTSKKKNTLCFILLLFLVCFSHQHSLIDFTFQYFGRSYQCWMVSIRSPISNYSILFSEPLGIVQRTPVTIGITVTLMFHTFFFFLLSSEVQVTVSFFQDSKVYDTACSLFFINYPRLHYYLIY